MVHTASSVQFNIPSKNGARVMAGIPCFNTANSIVDVVSATRRYVDEVVVVDDGSTDATAEKAKKVGATVISHVTNKGYGESIKTCFTAAKNRGAALVTIDGDGQHDPEEIPHLLDPIYRGEAEVVIGSRFLNPAQQIPSYRKLGITVINWLWNVGSDTKVSDSQSGCRAYSKWVIQNLSLFETGMSISVEILENIRRIHARIQEVPISCSYENNNSNPSWKALTHGFHVAFSVLRIRFRM